MKRNLLLVICIVLLTTVLAFTYMPVKYYNKTGEMQRDGMKEFVDTIQFTSAVQTMDISSAGYTQAPIVMVSAQRNTANDYNSPQVSIKTISNTSIVFNITEGSSSLVTIAGLSVLQGPSVVFVANPSSVILHVKCTGK